MRLAGTLWSISYKVHDRYSSSIVASYLGMQLQLTLASLQHEFSVKQNLSVCYSGQPVVCRCRTPSRESQ